MLSSSPINEKVPVCFLLAFHRWRQELPLPPSLALPQPFSDLFYPTSIPIPDHFATTNVFGWVPISHYRSSFVPTFCQPVFWLLGHHDFTCKEFMIGCSHHFKTLLSWILRIGLPWVVWYSANWHYNDMWCSKYNNTWHSRGIQRQRHMVFTWYSNDTHLLL